jgi:hypothetical protein
LSARCRRFQQLQGAVQEGHVAVRRDDVGAVGLDLHPVLNLEDLHAGVAPDEVGQDALVVRGQVLHQHKGHARIGVGGHTGKEGLERPQPPGRCADADDGKMLLRRFIRACTWFGRIGFRRRRRWRKRLGVRRLTLLFLNIFFLPGHGVSPLYG